MSWPRIAWRSSCRRAASRLRPRPVNWKNVADNYSDGMHITVAHPGLTRLFGQELRHRGAGVDRQDVGHAARDASSNWSERLVSESCCPTVDDLPPERQRLWTYFKLWPNVAFDIYPDQIDFMQFLPVSPTETLIREIAYVHPDSRREMRAARYLNWRINRQGEHRGQGTHRARAERHEFEQLHGRTLSESEVCLRSFARRMREPDSGEPQSAQALRLFATARAPRRGWYYRDSAGRSSTKNNDAQNIHTVTVAECPVPGGDDRARR